MAALQARAFAKGGYAVMTIDLFGCGDSEGELGQADWGVWLRDLFVAIQWLKKRCSAPLTLWGLRLGGLLCLQLAENFELPLKKIILWQPVIKGAAALTEFLRIGVAADMLKNRQNALSTTDMKQKLFSGETLELSGYDLNSNLAKAMDTADLSLYSKTDSPVYWLEVVRDASKPVSPAVKKTLEAWKSRGVIANHHQLCCESFWSSGEITECPELIRATTDILTR